MNRFDVVIAYNRPGLYDCNVKYEVSANDPVEAEKKAFDLFNLRVRDVPDICLIRLQSISLHKETPRKLG